ncbi:MAG: D-lyxose/D-mannose family sugar isomerase [Candidatus Aminicenantes bacterium]|nr:D-lyxose/D-mannose family sugar isomerase [Candidatus Aminicenantes bacterium]
MNAETVKLARKRAAEMCRRAGIALTPAEEAAMEVADFGLGKIDRYGFEIVVYVHTARTCAKEIILFPRQTCPEHRHPFVEASNPGKEETFRCRWGEVYLYVSGPPPAANPKAVVPLGDENFFTVWHEVVLRPGDQFTLPPDSLHWFQAGDEGAILSEFSSTSTDENDVWTNPAIRRAPVID